MGVHCVHSQRSPFSDTHIHICTHVNCAHSQEGLFSNTYFHMCACVCCAHSQAPSRAGVSCKSPTVISSLVWQTAGAYRTSTSDLPWVSRSRCVSGTAVLVLGTAEAVNFVLGECLLLMKFKFKNMFLLMFRIKIVHVRNLKWHHLRNFEMQDVLHWEYSWHFPLSQDFLNIYVLGLMLFC